MKMESSQLEMDIRNLLAKEDGTINNPNQSGLIKILKLGAEHWNYWTEAYPLEQLDLRGINFEKNRVSNFSGMKFRTKTDRIIVDGFEIDFCGCEFMDDTKFINAEFESETSFFNCIFKPGTSFKKSKFKENSSFSRASFENKCSFEHASFEGESFFIACTFGQYLDFSKSAFKKQCVFTNSVFGKGASEFVFPRDFAKMSKLQVSFFECQFHDQAVFACCHFLENLEMGCLISKQKDLVLNRMIFDGCIFEKSASFEGREFGAETSFGKSNLYAYFPRPGDEKTLLAAMAHTAPEREAEFKGVPYFHGCKLHSNTKFDHCRFNGPKNSEAAKAYRYLKSAMEQLKATREEQRFFKLEMQAERAELRGWKWLLSALYEICSDYGFSIWRPLLALAVFSLAIGSVHGLLANTCAEQPHCFASAASSTSGERTSDVIKYVLVNVTPVPGLDKMQTELRTQLFGEHGWIAITAIAFEILHKLIALVMTFLFALGLRNLFKMKS